jgi:hypothetical protein
MKTNTANIDTQNLNPNRRPTLRLSAPVHAPGSSSPNPTRTLLAALLVLVLAAPFVAPAVPRTAEARAAKENIARQAATVVSEAPQRPGRQLKLDQAKRQPQLVQKLESRLLDAWEQATAESAVRAAKSLSDAGVQVQGTNVIVVVQCASDAKPTDVAALITAQKGTVIRTGEAHVKASVPILALDQVAKLPGVSFVRTTIRSRAKNTVITEGRAATLANAWNSAGFTGQGAKIAILDTGFLGLSNLKANDEIPASAIAVDFSGEGLEVGTDHGCACAEMVYDMAPGAQLYLLKTLDPSDDEAAKNYCKAQGIPIISQSGGYDCLNFHDGVAYSSLSPHPITIANDALANGILWVNAAGNEQGQHALAAWRDANANDYLDWSTTRTSMNELWNGGNVIPAGEVLDIYLTWNEWPVTDQDFDLDLYRLVGSTWTYVTTSEDTQDGTQWPREHLTYYVTTAARYAVAIFNYDSTRSPTFIVRSYPYELFYFGYGEYNTPAPGSICIPADAASVFSVGAIDFTTYTNGPIELFSSFGPNNGAYTGNPTVMKPDVCGPDFLSTSTYGTEGFGGTSAATPTIAALAALVKGRYPAYTNTQIRTYLEGRGIDLGAAGKDNTYGYGPPVLPAASAVPQPSISSLTVTNGGAWLTWSAVSGATYRVQYKTNLADAAWSDLSPDVVANGATASMTNQPLVSRRFYRVLAL